MCTRSVEDVEREASVQDEHVTLVERGARTHYLGSADGALALHVVADNEGIDNEGIDNEVVGEVGRLEFELVLRQIRMEG